MKFLLPAPYRFPIFLLLLCLLLGSAVVWACQVPVFRYALERWTPDAYELVVTPGQGGLTGKEEKALEFLKEQRSSEEVPVNLHIRLAEQEGNASNAAVASLYYPGRHPGIEIAPIWQGDLTMENARRMVDSPIRRELATQILKGESSIWLVVESGNAEKDNAAEETLKKGAASAAEMLEIPEGVAGRDEVEAGTAGPIEQENILQSDVPLKIEFSVMRISRQDAAESIFLPMLLNLEDDLGDWAAEPMAFPIFGRGRMLEPLIGLGINESNILEHSGYLCGACSCEVKDQNPGMDLLMAVNWDAAMEGSEVMIEKVLPPLEGTAALLAAAPVPAAAAHAVEEPMDEPKVESTEQAPSPEVKSEGLAEANPFGRLWFVLGGVLLLLAMGSLIILRKKES